MLCVGYLRFMADYSSAYFLFANIGFPVEIFSLFLFTSVKFRKVWCGTRECCHSHTFRGRASIEDLAYWDAILAWQDNEDCTHSDHQAICMEINTELSCKSSLGILGGFFGWAATCFLALKFDISLDDTPIVTVIQITE